MTFAAVFAIGVGALMIAQWAVIILRGKVAGSETPVGGRGKLEMAFHLTAELATAFMLILSGVGLLLLGKEKSLSVLLVALGMLIYTLINSPGYFAQQRKWWMAGMFAALFVLTIVSLALAT